MITSNAIGVPPLRPEKPLFDSFYAGASGELFAGTIAGGSFHSIDDGKTWKPVANDTINWEAFTNRSASVRIINPAQQLCKPRDFGGSWNCVGVEGNVSAVDGKGKLYKCAGDHLEVSSDGGKIWHKVETWPSMPGNYEQCQMMAIHGETFYVAGQALYKSSDHGIHWSTVHSKNTDGAIIPEERILGLMSDKNGVLYATTVGTRAEHYYIFSSKDGGREWKRQTFGLPESWNMFALRRTLSDAIYFSAADRQTQGQEASIYRSVDENHATKLDINIKYGTFVDIQNGPGNSLYVITLDAIHKSIDEGRTWKTLSREGISW